MALKEIIEQNKNKGEMAGKGTMWGPGVVETRPEGVSQPWNGAVAPCRGRQGCDSFQGLTTDP